MDDYESLSHTTWSCKYHVVFIPKCRRKALYQELRRYLGECSATIWMGRRRQSGWSFWRSRRGDDCRGATITQALFGMRADCRGATIRTIP